MADVFTYQGVDWSSKLPTITIDGVAKPRVEFEDSVIAEQVAKLAPAGTGEQPAYIATGGGYGANDTLIAFEEKEKIIGNNIPSIKGNLYRDHPAFNEEKEQVRDAIRKHVGVEAIAKNPNLVEQTLRTFYSDEVNTKIGKEVVKSAIKSGKPVIYESAAIFDDTIERAELAHAQNPPVKTVLIAGDMALDAALAKQANATNKFNTAASYKLFSARFMEGRIDETLKAFDGYRIYNTDGEKPVLIAQKKGAGLPLEIIDPQRFAQFQAKAEIDLVPYTKDAAFTSNTMSQELWGMVKEQFKLPDLPAVEATNAPLQQRSGPAR